jgi:hypothetical protein
MEPNAKPSFSFRWVGLVLLFCMGALWFLSCWVVPYETPSPLLSLSKWQWYTQRMTWWFWLIALVIVLGTIWSWHRWYRWRTAPPPGHCRKCGYNLFGNVSGICPECGTPCGEQAKPR